VHRIVNPYLMDDFDRLYVRELPPLTILLVETKNSSYRIVVTKGSSVRVQGGPFFPELTSARLDGASLQGTGLEVEWLGVGLRMRITAGNRRLVTSPIRAISTEYREVGNGDDC